ncbi:hypothetical protein IAT38_000988 [Cryptococcus sp. DSM 104549]
MSAQTALKKKSSKSGTPKPKTLAVIVRDKIFKDAEICIPEDQFSADTSSYLSETIKAAGGEVVGSPEESTHVLINPSHPNYKQKRSYVNTVITRSQVDADEYDYLEVPYHWIACSIIQNRQLELDELELPAPIFVNPEEGGEWQPLRVYVSKNLHRYGGEDVQERAVQNCSERLEAGGAITVKVRSRADLFVVDESSLFAKDVRKEMADEGRDWQRIVERDWVDSCWKNKALRWTLRAESDEEEEEKSAEEEDSMAEEDVIVRRRPGRPPGKRRTEYSTSDDNFLLRYLAYHYPKGSWGSRKTYVEMSNDSVRYPETLRHTPQSWHERFKKNSSAFSQRVRRFIKAGIDSDLKTRAERQAAAEAAERLAAEKIAVKKVEEERRAVKRLAARNESRSSPPAEAGPSSRRHADLESDSRPPRAQKRKRLVSDSDSDSRSDSDAPLPPKRPTTASTKKGKGKGRARVPSSSPSSSPPASSPPRPTSSRAITTAAEPTPLDDKESGETGKTVEKGEVRETFGDFAPEFAAAFEAGFRAARETNETNGIITQDSETEKEKEKEKGKEKGKGKEARPTWRTRSEESASPAATSAAAVKVEKPQEARETREAEVVVAGVKARTVEKKVVVEVELPARRARAGRGAAADAEVEVEMEDQGEPSVRAEVERESVPAVESGEAPEESASADAEAATVTVVQEEQVVTTVAETPVAPEAVDVSDSQRDIDQSVDADAVERDLFGLDPRDPSLSPRVSPAQAARLASPAPPPAQPSPPKAVHPASELVRLREPSPPQEAAPPRFETPSPNKALFAHGQGKRAPRRSLLQEQLLSTSKRRQSTSTPGSSSRKGSGHARHFEPDTVYADNALPPRPVRPRPSVVSFSPAPALASEEQPARPPARTTEEYNERVAEGKQIVEEMRALYRRKIGELCEKYGQSPQEVVDLVNKLKKENRLGGGGDMYWQEVDKWMARELGRA